MIRFVRGDLVELGCIAAGGVVPSARRRRRHRSLGRVPRPHAGRHRHRQPAPVLHPREPDQGHHPAPLPATRRRDRRAAFTDRVRDQTGHPPGAAGRARAEPTPPARLPRQPALLSRSGPRGRRRASRITTSLCCPARACHCGRNPQTDRVPPLEETREMTPRHRRINLVTATLIAALLTCGSPMTASATIPWSMDVLWAT
jgi:hypothetical protein